MNDNFTGYLIELKWFNHKPTIAIVYKKEEMDSYLLWHADCSISNNPYKLNRNDIENGFMKILFNPHKLK